MKLTSKPPKLKYEPSQEEKKKITLRAPLFNGKRWSVWGEESEILRRRCVVK